MSPLSAVLRQAKVISVSQQSTIDELTTSANRSVIESIIELGILSSGELFQTLTLLFGLEHIELAQSDYQSLCQRFGLRELIVRYHALPVRLADGRLTVVVGDPTVQDIENDFRFASGYHVDLALANPSDIRGAIRHLYGESSGSADNQPLELTEDDLASLVTLTEGELESSDDLSIDDSPVSRFIYQVLVDAVRKKASDIHFEPYENQYRIRLRCDGILIESHHPASRLSRRLSSRLKILAKLDIAERRIPQDGRIKLAISDLKTIDLRVSTLPTIWGEKVVLRILDGGAVNLDIDQLGYNVNQKKRYLDALKQPQGMILMTGPTGSGKTVSLYSALKILNNAQRNISTAEDPVEIHLDGINQVQLNNKIGFGFAEALRAFLRQDPDVVMVGEIRDKQTAEIAVKASQTGHLVLSTLHTNSAAESIIRLKNMDVEPYNLVSSLSLIIAQRLVRTLCVHCKQPETQLEPIKNVFENLSHDTIYRANNQGCNQCTYGYAGRVGIYEVLPFTQTIANAVMEEHSISDIEALAVSQGMQTLKQSGLEKLHLGVTSFEELQRVLYC
jgi:type IV pilus assembly protein PilB